MKKVVGEFFKFKLAESEEGEVIEFKGCVSSVKETKKVTFALVTYGPEVFQIVLESKFGSLKIGMSIKGEGLIAAAKLKNSWLSMKDREVLVTKLEVLARPKIQSGIDWSKKVMNIQGEAFFNERPISLRHEREKAIFILQNKIVECFRETLKPLGFVEMRTPKISAMGAEGGANVFSLEYFGKTAFLSQSPQFYKEYGTGIFQKVFEIGPVFRAEKHNTSRHLNEYNSMDLEFGPIESFEEIMRLEVLYLKKLVEKIRLEASREQEILQFSLPVFESIPCLTFTEAKELLMTKGIENREKDFSPAEEKELGIFSKEELGSEFIFITHYPIESRPFYTAADLCPYSGELMTASFDLLFRGVEITTGGQRIHESEVLEESIRKHSMEPSEFEFFLKAHRAGLPPHGGLGLGLERLTAQLLGESSVKKCILYPRDTTRLSP